MGLWEVAVGSWGGPGAAPELFVLGQQRLLRPDEQVFEAMLNGWADQQLSRNLAQATVARRVEGVRRFQAFTNEWPWQWRPVDLEESQRSCGQAAGAVDDPLVSGRCAPVLRLHRRPAL